MNIIIKYEDLVIIESSSIKMTSFSNSFGKEFILENILFLSKEIDWDTFYMQIIRFTIEIIDSDGDKEVVYNFTFRIEDSVLTEDKIVLIGIPIIDYNGDNYNQYIIDILMLWSKNIQADFLNLDEDLKKAYNSCCRIWNKSNLIINTYNEIDLNRVKSDIDFYNLMADTLLGTKGYIGHDSYTFEDRLERILLNIEDNVIISLLNYENLKLNINTNDWPYIDKAFRKKYNKIMFIMN